MRIGLCGAHRTGKTTLALRIAEAFDLTYVPSPVSGIVAAHGFNMAVDNRLDTGMTMQQEVFEAVCAGLDTHTYVTDRTPIDVAGYLLADATAGAGTLTSQEETVAMMEKAIVETQRLFDIVLLIPPALTYVEADDKPPMNTAYQEHHHLLCRGMLLDDDLDLYWDELARVTTNIDLRMDWVRGCVAEAGLVVPGFQVAA